MRSGNYRLLLALILTVTCLISTTRSPSAAVGHVILSTENLQLNEGSDGDIDDTLVNEEQGVEIFFPLILMDYPGTNLYLGLSQFATGLDKPVGIVNAGDDRLFVLERGGRVRIVGSEGTVLPTPFLDITGRVDSSTGLRNRRRFSQPRRYWRRLWNSFGGCRRAERRRPSRSGLRQSG